MDVPPGTTIDGRYEVLDVLGRGAMAVVYQVRHLQLGSTHALKVLLLPTFSVQRRLLQEGRFQGALRHPNVVSVTDQVDVQGAPGLVMELVDGPSLDRMLARHELSIPQARALGIGIVQGVAAAHQLGLIHRDLKPANVLLSVSGNHPVPKIADFGLAKLLRSDAPGSSGTRSGTALGTPSYMAPEQIRDASTVDQRADVFALGALLYELVTGERAFHGSDMLDIFQRVASASYVPVQELVSDLPAGMLAAIDGALRVDREERLPSCGALLELWAGSSAEAVVADTSWGAEILADLRSLGSGRGAELSQRSGRADTFDIDAPVATWHTPPPTRRQAEPRPTRWGAWMAGFTGLTVVGLAALLLGGLTGAVGLTWWWRSSERPVPVVLARQGAFTVDGVPTVSEDPRTQAAFERSWDLFLVGDLEGAESEARGLLEPTKHHFAVRLLLVATQIRDDPRDAVAELRAVSADPQGPRVDELYVALVGRRDRLASVASLLSRQEDEVLGRWIVANTPTVPLNVRRAALHDLTSLAPTFVPAWSALIERTLRDGDGTAARTLLEEAEAVPGNAGALELLVARAHVHLHHGEPDQARALLEAVREERGPRVDGPLVAALTLLGEQGSVDAIAADQVARSATARARFANWHAEGLIGLGRLDEASAVLDVALALEEVRRPQMLDLVRTRVAVARLDGTPDALERGLAALDKAAGGLDPESRGTLEPMEAILEGLQAVRVGDVDAARAVVGGMEGRGASARQREMVKAALDAELGATVSLSDESRDRCMQRYWTARWSEPELTSGAMEAWSQVVVEDSPCGWFGGDRFARADALARLAAVTLAAGSPADARLTLDRYRELWPTPDLQLEAESIAGRVDEELLLR